jgi:hypothetical protein
MEVIATKEILKEVNEAVNKEEVHIKASSETPEVILNKKEGEIKFSGRSMPEDAKSFYNPLKQWIAEYAENPAPGTRVVFEYEYFNTASSKMIFELIHLCKSLKESGHDLKIEWHYLEDDDDILDSGETFQEISGLTFNFYPYE